MQIRLEEEQREEKKVSSRLEPPKLDVKKMQIICGVLGVLTLLFIFRTVNNLHQYEERIAKQKTEISQLKKEVAALDASADKKTGEKAKTTDGKKADVSIDPKAFLAKLLTWDSLDAYNEVRSWLKKDYGIADSDALLTSFMPGVDDAGFGNANMRFKEADLYKLDEADGSVSYFALCKVANQIDGNAGSGKVGVFYTVTKDGNIRSVSAYSLVR